MHQTDDMIKQLTYFAVFDEKSSLKRLAIIVGTGAKA